MDRIANVSVGKADVGMDTPSHIHGIKEGNALGNIDRDPGLYAFADYAKATARRSTTINPKSRDPIDPRSPNLSPA